MSELYQFNRGELEWRYTNGVENVVFSGQTYTPEIISYDRIGISADVFKSPINLSLPVSNLMVADVFNNFYCLSTQLRIWRDGLLLWAGRIIRPSISNDKATLRCESIFSAMKRLGVRTAMEVTCRHYLYSPGCGVSRSLNTVYACAVTNVVGNVITVPSLPGDDSFYNLGIVQFGLSAAMILNKTGDAITLSVNIGISIGDNVDVSLGCDRRTSTCNTRFVNLINYGGFPAIPNNSIYANGVS